MTGLLGKWQSAFFDKTWLIWLAGPLGLADRHETYVFRRLNPYDREAFKFVTAHQGMELFRRKARGLFLEL